MSGEIQVESLVGVSPALYGASVDLDEGEQVSPNTDELGNIMRVPVIIDEIRFMISFTFDAVTDSKNLGGSIRCSLRMGQHNLTNGFVPTWNFGTVIDEGFDFDDDNGASSVSNYRWVLPRPLIVPPGNCIIPTFFRTLDGWGGTARVWITYGGRLLAPGIETPRVIPIPYVSCWTPNTAVSLAPISNEEFKNPFRNKLHVQRFIGRYGRQNGPPDSSLDYVDNWQQTLFPDSSFPTFEGTPTVKVEDSQGYQISQSYVPLGSAFDSARRSMTFNRGLDFSQRYVMYLKDIPSSRFNPMISMVGWREEEAH